MLDEIRNFMSILDEELKYHQSIEAHKSSLEATLWGLEEQIRMEENSSASDQEEINKQINQCRVKILSCKKLINSHKTKLEKMVNDYKIPKNDQKIDKSK